MKIIIFGAGNTGIRVCKEELSVDDELVAFFDNDINKWGTKLLGHDVYQPSTEAINRLDYDEIVIASVQGGDEIKNQLVSYGLDESVIRTYKKDYNCMPFFLHNLRVLFEENGVVGSTGEAGVFRGETAAIINKEFNNRKLYLFDTFDGFSDVDTEIEIACGYSKALAGQYSNTSESVVMSKMIYPENVIIKKGYFPDSASDINDRFCLFRLDLDLFRPTALGLDYIHDKMVKGGVVIVHDFFGDSYKGISEAVNMYVLKHGELSLSPLGDRLSIVITGY